MSSKTQGVGEVSNRKPWWMRCAIGLVYSIHMGHEAGSCLLFPRGKCLVLVGQTIIINFFSLMTSSHLLITSCLKVYSRTQAIHDVFCCNRRYHIPRPFTDSMLSISPSHIAIDSLRCGSNRWEMDGRKAFHATIIIPAGGPKKEVSGEGERCAWVMTIDIRQWACRDFGCGDRQLAKDRDFQFRPGTWSGYDNLLDHVRWNAPRERDREWAHLQIHDIVLIIHECLLSHQPAPLKSQQRLFGYGSTSNNGV